MKYTLKNKEIELTDEEVKEIIKQNSNPVEEKRIGIAIKSRWTGSIIFQSSKTTWKDAVEEADLIGANLIGADLSEANLIGANLIGADLREADLSGANLIRANLIGADLREADLREANLREANLRGANLRGAEFMNAKFYGKTSDQKVLKESQIDDFLSALGFKREA